MHSFPNCFHGNEDKKKRGKRSEAQVEIIEVLSTFSNETLAVVVK